MTHSHDNARMTAEMAHLQKEIALNRDFVNTQEALFLSMTWTWLCVEKVGRTFFAAFGTTDAQFNALMILWDYRAAGLRQHELADLLVVNRASAGGVIDRMEGHGWVRRETDPADRRAYFVYLTAEGTAKLKEVRAAYYKLLAAALGDVDPAALSAVLHFNDAFRARLAALPVGISNPGKKSRKADHA